MKALGIGILLAMLLGGCSAHVVPGISMIDNRFKANQCTATLPVKQVKQRFDVGTIDVTRTFFISDTNQVLIHEHGTLDNAFEFSVGARSLMYAGFEFTRYTSISAGRYHDYIQGYDRHNKPIYLLFSGVNPLNDFDVFYSDSPDLLTALLPCVEKEIPTNVHFTQLPSNNEILDLDAHVVSDWGVRMLFLHNVINRKYFPFDF